MFPCFFACLKAFCWNWAFENRILSCLHTGVIKSSLVLRWARPSHIFLEHASSLGLCVCFIFVYSFLNLCWLLLISQIVSGQLLPSALNVLLVIFLHIHGSAISCTLNVFHCPLLPSMASSLRSTLFSVPCLNCESGKTATSPSGRMLQTNSTPLPRGENWELG